MNSILVVMYPKLEDPHFGSLAQFLNIAHHFLDLGMLYIPNNSFHVDLSYCRSISPHGICRVAFLQVTRLKVFDCFGVLFMDIRIRSANYRWRGKVEWKDLLVLARNLHYDVGCLYIYSSFISLHIFPTCDSGRG
jgi:hypothetical protein